MKGSGPKNASYAQGGAVLGRTRDFMKEPDRFRQQDLNGKFVPAAGKVATADAWGKSDKLPTGAQPAPPGKGKSLKAVTPRS